jgi:hypothetical protein
MPRLREDADSALAKPFSAHRAGPHGEEIGMTWNLASPEFSWRAPDLPRNVDRVIGTPAGPALFRRAATLPKVRVGRGEAIWRIYCVFSAVTRRRRSCFPAAASIAGAAAWLSRGARRRGKPPTPERRGERLDRRRPTRSAGARLTHAPASLVRASTTEDHSAAEPQPAQPPGAARERWEANSRQGLDNRHSRVYVHSTPDAKGI